MKEGTRYKLTLDTFNFILLTVTYVEGSILFLKSEHTDTNYKYDTRKDKLYFYNTAYSTWDNVEGEFKEYMHSALWDDGKKPKVLSNEYYGD